MQLCNQVLLNLYGTPHIYRTWTWSSLCRYMMTSSNGNIFCVTRPLCGEFTSEPVTWSFGAFFDLRLNNRLSQQSRRRWIQTPSRSFLRHCNELDRIRTVYLSFNGARHNDDYHVKPFSLIVFMFPNIDTFLHTCVFLKGSVVFSVIGLLWWQRSMIIHAS